MSDDKDFLNQFSNQGKPASFQEEERIPVTKQRKPLNVKLLIGLLIAAIALGILAYFLFFAPKIEVPNFVGKTKNDVAAWTKQQGIEQSGILFDERYDFDTDEGIIISQSIPEGKKVKNNVKMDFVISLGADPEEKIKVPDIKNMNKDEIQNWVSQNKLAKTRVMTAYNDEVEENEVIDYSFSGCEEDTFTRGCSLRINISKGSAPAGKVTVEDFVKKMYESAEAWAKTKKVNLVKVEQYSSTVEKGHIISQSVESGKTLDEGADFVVTVSLGKAVTMPNMYEWTENQIRAWCSKNGVVLSSVDYKYDPEANGECIGQSINPNTLVREGDYLDVVISLDDPDIRTFSGTTLSALEEWIREVNSKGAGLKLNVTRQLHDTIAKDGIISISDKVSAGGTVYAVISDGKNILLQDLPEVKVPVLDDQGKETGEYEVTSPAVSWDVLAKTPTDYNESQIRQLLAENKIDNYELTYKKSSNESLENGVILVVTRADSKAIGTNTYLPESVTITFVINDKNQE